MTETLAPRIDPVQPPYDDETAAWLARWMPPGGDVKPLALFRTLAVHRDLASRMRPLGAGILAHGLLEPRLRELVIQRTCALCGAEYEWGVHAAAFAGAVGLDEQRLRATVEPGSAAPIWDEQERTVLELAEQLHADARLSGKLFTRLREHFDDAQILELAVTAGWYHTIAYVIGTAAVEREPWAARFP